MYRPEAFGSLCPYPDDKEGVVYPLHFRCPNKCETALWDKKEWKVRRQRMKMDERIENTKIRVGWR